MFIILFLPFLSNAQPPTDKSGLILLPDRLVYVREGLGTIVRVTVGRHASGSLPDGQVIKAVVNHEINFANRHFDKRRRDSEISVLGHSYGLRRVSKSLWSVLAIAQSVCEATDGAFNAAYLTPGIKNDVTGCFYYHLSHKAWAITLQNGTVFDLDGLAKGWIIGRIAHRLKALGINEFMVEIGGDIVVGKGISKPWHIGIQRPKSPDGKPDAIITLFEENTSIFTSGTYERGPHIFDTKTGKYPTREYSATVRGPNPAIADALATAALISGPHADYYKRFPNYAFVFSEPDGLPDATGLEPGESLLLFFFKP